jgi:tungstate transport system substrate-binding protein
VPPLSLESPESPRAPKRRFLVPLALVLAIGLIVVPVATAASPVIVQGTTDIRDAGLLEEVIEPGFDAAYPQYELKYVPVGTGQALTNAKAGQGDAVVTHAPSLEKTFVEEGYSLEKRGRAIFYSDYVIVGATADPAGVATAAPHNSAAAFEAIARAGAEGKANFVSRGDNSGTNTEEKAIWKLTGVELNSLGEPGKKGTKEDASWYHKGGGGQAETVQLANQCPFSGGGCYDITDRGTFNRLSGQSVVSGLKIVSEKNEESAPGGMNLLTNPFDVYIVNPAKVTNVTINVAGAEALVEYLTSEKFQSKLASFPNTTSPAFFADAHAVVAAKPTFTKRTVKANGALTFSGTLASALPGAPILAGQPVLLQRLQSLHVKEAPTYKTIARGVTTATGSYKLQAKATRGGLLRIETPKAYPSFAVEPLLAVGALSETELAIGRLAVQAKIAVKGPRVAGSFVTLRGTASPSTERDPGAQIVVLGRKQGQRQFHAVRRLRPGKGSSYKVNLRLATGKWKLRVSYRDPGAVLPATSRAVSVSVPR